MDRLLDEIRDYLLQKGCKIEYPVLINNFKSYLYNPDPQIQSQIRTQFKDYVNRLATVSLENNTKFINLRPEFRQSQQNLTDPQVQRGQHQQVSSHAHQIAAQPQPIPQLMVRTHSVADNITRSPVRHSSNVVTELNHPQHRLPQSFSQQENINQMHFQTRSQPNHQSQSQISSHEQPKQYYSPTHTSHTRPQSYQQQQYQPHQSQAPHQYNLPSRLQQTQHLNQQHNLQQNNLNRPKSTPMSPKSLPATPQKIPLPPQHDHQSRQADSHNFKEPAPRQPLTPVHTIPLNDQMPPPRPPPRRRQSNASLFSRPADDGKTIETRSHNQLSDLGIKSASKVRERALKLNSHSVSGHLNNMANLVKSHSMRENRLSRDSTMGSLSSASQRLGYNPSMRSRSSHREDESDSSSFQPMDMLRKRWIVEACNCNHRALVNMLREDPSLATFKDVMGYTALHWAAKAGNLDIIRLMIDNQGVSVNVRSSSNGYTPLHLAYMYKRTEAINLLMNVFRANHLIRDYGGRRPHQFSFTNKR